MTVRRYNCLCILLFVTLFFGISLSSRADDPDVRYTDENGNEVRIVDELDFLSEREEEELAEQMAEMTEFGNIVIWTTSESGTVYETQADVMAEKLYWSCYDDDEDGIIFLIDMDWDLEHGMIQLNAFGSLSSKIRPSQIDSIMDNVYNEVDYHDWAGYASSAFRQVQDYLVSGKIAEPMKWVSNFFLAIILALLVNFILISYMIRRRKAQKQAVLSGLYQKFRLMDARMVLTNTTKVYSPPSSSGGGGGGGRSGGGGGGGGHSSGGGHRV